MTESELKQFIERLPNSVQAADMTVEAAKKQERAGELTKNYRIAKILDHLNSKMQAEARSQSRGFVIDFKIMKNRFDAKDEDIADALKIFASKGYHLSERQGVGLVMISW